MYVVTGGAGFIGSNIVFALEQKNWGKIAICDTFSESDKWQNIAKRQIAEIIPPKDLFEFLGDNSPNIQTIIHMGAISSTTEKNVDKIIENNFQLSCNIWRWSSLNQVPFIYASSAATYGAGKEGFEDDFSSRTLSRLKPLNPYAWSKHLFDQWIARTLENGEQKPPQWVGLKFFNVYGPNEYHKGSMMSVVAQIYPCAKSQKACKLFESHHPDYDHGGQLRDFVYVGDCRNMVTWLIENPHISGLFNCGSGKARSFKELASAVYTALNHKAQITYVPTPEHIRDRYQYFTQAPMDRLKKAGWHTPPTSLEDGVSNYVQNFLDKDDPYL